MTLKPSAAKKNLAELVMHHGEESREKLALAIPTEFDGESVTAEARVTYGELAIEVARLQEGLRRAGFRQGDAVVVMFGVRMELYALVLALFASGMVAVLIDSGMGKKRVVEALKLSGAKGIVSLGAVLKFWPAIPVLWRMKRYGIDGGRFGVRSFDELRGVGGGAMPDVASLRDRSSALITYTSGTTGQPKGSDRTHDLLIAQHLALSEHFPHRADDVDLPSFPVVPLHNLAAGLSTVMPAMDYGAPAAVSPAVVVGQIREEKVTRIAGAPAYLTALVDYLLERDEALEGVRELVCGGAPTPLKLCRKLATVFPKAQRTIVYGSTEAEPIASVPMDEAVESKGQGYLVGRIAEVATVCIVDLPEEPPPLGEEELAPFEVGDGEVGEIAVKGPHVLRRYIHDPVATRTTKLATPGGEIWHRTGDMARVDGEGRLWLMGRRKDVLRISGEVVYPFVVESAARELLGVSAAALVDAGAGPVLVAVADGAADEATLKVGLEELLNTLGLGGVEILFLHKIPVDARHNSKVDRNALRASLKETKR